MNKVTAVSTLLVVLLTGCSPGTRKIEFAVLPDELKDCKFFKLSDSAGNSINVARCPNSSTTVQNDDKAHTTSVIIDGTEYIKNE